MAFFSFFHSLKQNEHRGCLGNRFTINILIENLRGAQRRKIRIMDIIVLQIAHHKGFVTGCLSPPQVCLLPYIPVSLPTEIIFCLYLASLSSSVFQFNALKKIQNSLCTVIHDDLYPYHPNFFCFHHRLEALKFHNPDTNLSCFP